MYLLWHLPWRKLVNKIKHLFSWVLVSRFEGKLTLDRSKMMHMMCFTEWLLVYPGLFLHEEEDPSNKKPKEFSVDKTLQINKMWSKWWIELKTDWQKRELKRITQHQKRCKAIPMLAQLSKGILSAFRRHREDTEETQHVHDYFNNMILGTWYHKSCSSNMC